MVDSHSVSGDLGVSDCGGDGAAKSGDSAEAGKDLADLTDIDTDGLSGPGVVAPHRPAQFRINKES